MPQRYENEEIAPLGLTLMVTVIGNGDALIVPVRVEPGWGFTPPVGRRARRGVVRLEVQRRRPLPPPHAIEFSETNAVVGVTKWPTSFQSFSLLS